ncbi:MAG: SMI1/KNR4 family protein [Capnocytophaga sp.]|nr:SMI1/KNR4 family protein [Capnocytophaga sp.]
MQINTFTENLNTLQNFIAQSKGEFIQFGNEAYRFTKKADITFQELADFEVKYQIQLPDTFKTFLLTLGSCTIFEDEFGFSYDFLVPHQWEFFSNNVFEGTGENFFPHILFVCSTKDGHQAGFVTTQQNSFGTFYSDIPPEYWEEDTTFLPFEQWLNEEIKLCKN